jgi:hypothetical protein
VDFAELPVRGLVNERGVVDGPLTSLRLIFVGRSDKGWAAGGEEEDGFLAAAPGLEAAVSLPILPARDPGFPGLAGHGAGPRPVVGVTGL